MPVAQSAQGTPLVYVNESPGSRVVVVTFGADESNLTSAPGFPVLLGNALDWLARPLLRHGSRRHAAGIGAARARDVHGNGAARDRAGQAPVPLARVSDTALGVLRAPGLYVVEGGGARSTFAVNVGDPQLSNLTAPAPSRRRAAAPSPPAARRRRGGSTAPSPRSRWRSRMVDVAAADYGVSRSS